MHAIGVASSPLRQQDLTAGRFATRLTRVVGDPSVRERVEVLGERIRSETGVRIAVDAFEQVL